ncbi:hypothetical protein FPSE_06690 [Fusarium pseudograminearum CS3096]|uniref:Uncharacterized protein n=1 Tax=Fusarium pseudograminearum (strain CS3096) TaxID=1028729 RepID=K3VFR4_FUSPC|nr:hypothetical protein FPSE_06690 [Fusarium pseudograminearum CS3096]EKJ73077.1 hypothetical protein FPSE_06690 [Fusarium pseudograminearum CS3096]
MRNELASELGTTLPLPMELRRYVAQRLSQEYAVAKKSEKYLSSLAIATVLDAAYVMPKVIYIGEDHLGIRQVILSDSSTSPEIDCISGVWWKAILVQADQILKGVKIRQLTYFDGSVDQSTAHLPSCVVPQHPEIRYRTRQFCQVPSREPPRLSVFRYNSPNITGFSICCGPAPIALHAHTSDEDLSFYQHVSEYSTWIYMPLEKNERIVRIWMRARNCLNREVALVFETDKGHTKLFGAQTTPNLLACRWILLDAPQGQPGHLFFDDNPDGIRWISLDSQPPIGTSLLHLPVASCPHPCLPNNDGFIWSSASVQDVVNMRVCRRNTRDRTEVMGLLFYYSDGKQASVGQVRLDKLDELQTIDHSQSLYLGFERSKRWAPYISKVRTSVSQLDNTVNMWFEVSWSGTLEWWLSWRQCQVYQDGRKSLPTRF